jgi:RNA polymerase sigma-70 factor, ECF subfamily
MRPISPEDRGERRRSLLPSDRSAQFESLFHAYGPRVLAYALRRTSWEDAEEVVAETFMITWRRLPEVAMDPVPWLLAVARRVLANQRRAAGRRKALEERLKLTSRSSTAVSANPADEVGARMALEDALASLSEWDREALLLVAWDGLDNQSAAVVMDCSPARFAVKLHRARQRLTKRMQVVGRQARDRRIAPVASPEENR